MSAAPVVLDDVAYADLLGAAIERIPAASQGQWTLHAPVDPGITLLELFAHLLDQRVYWLDQESDEQRRAVLSLIGEAPRHAEAAATVVRLVDRSSDAPTTSQPVPADTALELAAPGAAVTFTTKADATILPVVGVGVFAGGADRITELVRGTGVLLLRADGEPDAAQLMLRLRGAPQAGDRVSLLLVLDALEGEARHVAPEWLGGDSPPPARLTFAVSRAVGAAPVDLEAGTVHDGTGGLRRSGLLAFDAPADWAADAPPDADGVADYSVHIRTAAATYSSPPRLFALVPNAVIASHRSPGEVDTANLREQVRNWLALPGRALDLHAPGELDDDPGSVTLTLRERGVDHDWSAVADLSFAGPGSRVFVIDRAAGVLRFGDGLTGHVPALDPADGAAAVSVAFAVGAGPRGNLGTALEWRTDLPGGVTATSAVAAEGGEEPESPHAARDRVAAGFRRAERAVLREDYETLAKGTQGVAIARARASIGGHPSFPCTPVPGAVSVFIVPRVPREGTGDVAAPRPDPGALEAVATRLQNARLIGTQVFVREPRYRHVRLAVTLSSEPAGDASVQRQLETEFRRFLDPLEGGDEEQGWPWGEPLRPSALLRHAAAALDRQHEVAAVAVGLDGDPPSEACQDVPIGADDLVVLDELTVRWAPVAATEGGLR
jgi:hypothetical protein